MKLHINGELVMMDFFYDMCEMTKIRLWRMNMSYGNGCFVFRIVHRAGAEKLITSAQRCSSTKWSSIVTYTHNLRNGWSISTTGPPRGPIYEQTYNNFYPKFLVKQSYNVFYKKTHWKNTTYKKFTIILG